jgi:hypothetical protein
MQEAVLIFFGLIIVSIVNFLGFKQLTKTLEATRGKN